jgi:hypothetical protein
MIIRRIIGLVLIAGGGVLIYLGVTTGQNSFAGWFSENILGRPTDTTLYYIIGGVAAIVIGLVLLLIRGRRRY